MRETQSVVHMRKKFEVQYVSITELNHVFATNASCENVIVFATIAACAVSDMVITRTRHLGVGKIFPTIGLGFNVLFARVFQDIFS